MRYFAYFGAATGLICCLAATPARADLAAPEAGVSVAPAGAITSALDALTSVMDAAATVSGASLLGSVTTSTGPATAPATGLGVDSANLPTLGVIATADMSSNGLLAPGATQVAGDSSQAAPPAALLQAPVNSFVASPVAPSTDLSSMSASVSSPTSITGQTVTPVVSPVPLPATIVLFGSALLGLLPLRRSVRSFPGA